MITVCEVLERRMLLSASTLLPHAAAAPKMTAPAIDVPLSGTYIGVLHLNGKRATASSDLNSRAMSITFSPTGTLGQLGGSVAAAGLGTFNFVGADLGSQILAVFGGSSAGAGEFSASLRGNELIGRFVETFGGRIVEGTFRAAAGGTPVAASMPAGSIGGTPAAPVMLSRTYSGATRLNHSNQNTTLTVLAESADGLVNANLKLGAQTFNLTGFVDGTRFDYVLSGPTAEDGTARVVRPPTVLRSSIAERTAAGLVRGHFLLTNGSISPTPSKPAAQHNPIPGSPSVGASAGTSNAASSSPTIPVFDTGNAMGMGAGAGSGIGTGISFVFPTPTGGVGTPVTGIGNGTGVSFVFPTPTGGIGTPITGIGTTPTFSSPPGSGSTFAGIGGFTGGPPDASLPPNDSGFGLIFTTST